ncbi:Transcriptional regulator LytR [bioreactor metagenome]|uniref:Transcriptional regulator LytR n=1 Tax=bioreactor metagenome TaxID=1076179 RepID=A0A644TB35_9ZZZZ|nr:LCP family protein [Negativicutes bacterium]
MRTARRRVRWSRVLLLVIILIMLVGTLAGAAVYTYKTVFKVLPAGTQVGTVEAPDSGRINILLLGLDDGDREHQGSPRRSDTIIVASINTDDGTASLLSIPRDTRVVIPGHKDYDKITHACFYGGPQLAEKTVEGFLQLPIHYYAAVDWQAFIKLVDLVGGVNLYVERDMNYEDPYANLQIHLEQGYQHLDGHEAGEYIRYRSDELGDIGRVQRQQRFIKAFSSEALNIGLILKTPGLVTIIKENVETNIPPLEMVKLAYNVNNFTSGNVHIEMLPGRFSTVGGLSYWNPDADQIAQLVDRMFNSRSATMSSVFDRNKRNN